LIYARKIEDFFEFGTEGAGLGCALFGGWYKKAPPFREGFGVGFLTVV
jgi:hypothetical protein